MYICSSTPVPLDCPPSIVRNYQPNDDIYVLYVCLQARMDIYHPLDINQCTPKATKQRTNNHGLLNNEPKMATDLQLPLHIYSTN